jgi:hypothetical protein
MWGWTALYSALDFLPRFPVSLHTTQEFDRAEIRIAPSFAEGNAASRFVYVRG